MTINYEKFKEFIRLFEDYRNELKEFITNVKWTSPTEVELFQNIDRTISNRELNLRNILELLTKGKDKFSDSYTFSIKEEKELEEYSLRLKEVIKKIEQFLTNENTIGIWSYSVNKKDGTDIKYLENFKEKFEKLKEIKF